MPLTPLDCFFSAPTQPPMQACWCYTMTAAPAGAGCETNKGRQLQQTVWCCTAQAGVGSSRRQQESSRRQPRSSSRRQGGSSALQKESSRRSQAQQVETAAAEGALGLVC